MKAFGVPAVFLDRDGVMVREIDHPRGVEDLRILPGVGLAIARINQKKYRVVVVSNQAGVAKGFTTEEKVIEMNEVMAERIYKKGGIIDALYYCPHHIEGTVVRYAVRCRCRKPGIGMITKAVRDLNIDIKKSFLVGDKTSDILAGKRAGLRTVLIKSGYAGKDNLYRITPDFIINRLSDLIPLL